MKIKIHYLIWILLFLNNGIITVYTSEYYLPQTGFMFAPYGYLPLTICNLINVIGIILLGILYIIKKRKEEKEK